MSKFGKLMGKLEFVIKGEEIVLTPKMGDNRKLLKIMNNNNLNESDKMDKLFDFISELMISSYPEENIGDLKQAVEFNLNDFMKEILIGFGWTTRYKWGKIQGDAEKKLMSEN
jgi:hypothetical protein